MWLRNKINSEGGVPLSHNFVSRSHNDREGPQGQDLQLQLKTWEISDQTELPLGPLDKQVYNFTRGESKSSR